MDWNGAVQMLDRRRRVSNLHLTTHALRPLGGWARVQGAGAAWRRPATYDHGRLDRRSDTADDGSHSEATATVQLLHRHIRIQFPRPHGDVPVLAERLPSATVRVARRL